MIWVLLGVVAGALIAGVGHLLPVAATPTGALTTAMSHAGAGCAHALVQALGLGADPALGHVSAAVAGTLTPSLVCLAIAEAVTTSRAARSAATTLLLACAAASFLWIPGPQALLLCAASVALGGVLASARGALLEMPAAAVVTALSLPVVFDVATGAHRAAAAANVLTVTLGGSSGLWRAVLAVAALMPALAALGMLLRRR